MELFTRDSHGTLLKANLPRIDVLKILGYGFDCFVLPNGHKSRPIWGLDGVRILVEGFSLKIIFESKR